MIMCFGVTAVCWMLFIFIILGVAILLRGQGS
jgi:hypothetical protein